MNSRALVVTTQIDGLTWSRLWDGDAPLMFGRPFRWALERTPGGIRVRYVSNASSDKPKEIRFDSGGREQKIIVKDPQLENSKIIFLVRPARALEGAVKIAGEIATGSAPAEITGKADDRWIKNSAKWLAAGLGVLSLITVFWPSPGQKTEELVPPQFTKIIMAKTTKPEAGGTAGGPASVPNVKRAQDAAVVQAFRAKALQSAVSNLLKGGMTRLLAQSDFAGGAVARAGSSGIFNSKSSALVALAPATGLVAGRNVGAGGVGGGGIGGGGTGVGYGKGAAAGVGGQGKGFVSMDVPGSSVEEGLTKDEVGAVIHKHMSEIRYCYESAMVRTPDIEGRLVADFTIGASGMVRTSAVKSSTLPDPRLDDCIIRRLMSWKFPQPKGGVDVAVSYPFIFKTLGR